MCPSEESLEVGSQPVVKTLTLLNPSKIIIRVSVDAICTVFYFPVRPRVMRAQKNMLVGKEAVFIGIISLMFLK